MTQTLDTTAADTASEGREVLSFLIGEQEFCVDVMAVREIRGWTPSVPLPRAPAYVQGVINLRGAVLPILDMAARLGMPVNDPTPRNVIIVVCVEGKLVGLLVESVCEILVVPPGGLQPTSELQGGGAQAFVSDIVAIDDRMIGAVALDQIMLHIEAEAA